MARKRGEKRQQGRAKGTAAKWRPRPKLRLLLPLVALGVVAFLYAQPVASYVETRQQLSARRVEVRQLRGEKQRLEQRLAATTSLAALGREARRIGYVKPGERLFIVKGIPAWRRAHAGSAASR